MLKNFHSILDGLSDWERETQTHALQAIKSEDSYPKQTFIFLMNPLEN